MNQIQVVDALAWSWLALALLSTLYVAYDQFKNNNPEPTVMRWGFILVTLYMGPIALLLYVMADKEPKPDPDVPQPSPDDNSMNRKEVAELLVGGAATGAMILLLIQYGIPIAMRQLRQIRQDRGNEPLLSQDQFDELIERLQDLARGLAVMEAKYERKDGPEK